MATYKVLQDIEAEDKLLGPLSLKQFIFAAITIGLGFVCFMILGSPGPMIIKVFLMSPLLPVMLVFGFLAAPIGRDQPNDIWLLARLRFLLKPRTRIWDQDGVNQLVTITAPKRRQEILTNGLSQTEVKSRLHALANTLDSRGWAIKNVSTNLFSQPGYLNDANYSDRLIDPSSLPQDVPIADITEADDMLDTSNNSTAQYLDQLVQKSTDSHRKQAIENMHGEAPQQPADYWFLHESQAPAAKVPDDYAMFNNQQVVTPGADNQQQAADLSPEEEELAEKIVSDSQDAQSHINDRLKNIQPLHDRDGNPIQSAAQATQVSDNGQIDDSQATNDDNQRQDDPNPAILELARNDDLNVATIARQAQKISNDDGEVVISLH